MSVAMPPQLGTTGASTNDGKAGLTIFGRRVSWDAVLLAGVGIIGVIFAYRFSGLGSAAPVAGTLPSSSDSTSAGPVGGVLPITGGVPPPTPTGGEWCPPHGMGIPCIIHNGTPAGSRPPGGHPIGHGHPNPIVLPKPKPKPKPVKAGPPPGPGNSLWQLKYREPVAGGRGGPQMV